MGRQLPGAMSCGSRQGPRGPRAPGANPWAYAYLRQVLLTWAAYTATSASGRRSRIASAPISGMSRLATDFAETR